MTGLKNEWSPCEWPPGSGIGAYQALDGGLRLIACPRSDGMWWAGIVYDREATDRDDYIEKVGHLVGAFAAMHSAEQDAARLKDKAPAA